MYEVCAGNTSEGAVNGAVLVSRLFVERDEMQKFAYVARVSCFSLMNFSGRQGSAKVRLPCIL
jgi:hypothetical protein